MKTHIRLNPTIALIAILIVVAVVRGIFLSAGKDSGEMKVSEKTYYMSRISRVFQTWQDAGRNAERDQNGRIKGPHPIYFVIDTAKPAVWMEKGGEILPDSYVDLPKKMKWTFCHSRPEEDKALSGLVRLTIRGVHTDRVFPETFYLIGREPRGGHINFQFDGKSNAAGFGFGVFNLRPYGSLPETKSNGYESIVVSNTEYEDYHRSLAAAANQPASEKPEEPTEKSPIRENLANWLKVERQLYQEIEKQASEKGFELKGLRIETGPDYSAAHADVEGDRGEFRLFLGIHPYVALTLKIDYLDNDTWYVSGGPDLQRRPSQERVDLEFLVRATGDIPRSEYGQWIEQGRKKQLAGVTPKSQWRATLPNGAVFEFIGICESPSGGKSWWGPDGSPLDAVPYFNSEAILARRADRKVFEIVWRWKLSPIPNCSTKHSLEGCVGSGSRQIRDRYGYPMDALHAAGCAFEKSRETTTLKLGASAGTQNYQWITLKNISLVPGKDPGFQMEVEK